MIADGKFDEALRVIDEMILLSDGSDALPHVYKANTFFQKVLPSPYAPFSC
jgi:hypothetical protein